VPASPPAEVRPRVIGGFACLLTCILWVNTAVTPSPSSNAPGSVAKREGRSAKCQRGAGLTKRPKGWMTTDTPPPPSSVDAGGEEMGSMLAPVLSHFGVQAELWAGRLHMLVEVAS